jgi:hypothetical protein
LTGWAGFCCSFVAAFESGATCMKEQINAKMVTILNICLPQVVDWIVVSKNVGTPAFVSLNSKTARDIPYCCQKITTRWQKGDAATSTNTREVTQLGISQPDIWPVFNPVCMRVDYRVWHVFLEQSDF